VTGRNTSLLISPTHSTRVATWRPKSVSRKKQYKGLETDQVRQFKQLQEENARLKRLVAELSLDKPMLQDLLSTKL
jgi:hypothetical protein